MFSACGVSPSSGARMRQPSTGCVMMCSYSSSVRRLGLVQHRLAHADLADVVDVSAELDLAQHLAVEAHLAGDRAGVRGSRGPNGRACTDP